MSHTLDVACVNTHERAFSVVAPSLWNCLSGEIRQAPYLIIIRKLLKTVFFKAFLLLGIIGILNHFAVLAVRCVLSAALCCYYLMFC